ncbi:hypothetical protein Daus18300_005586 [Diaporthe australafricana]|uniref:Uncharacterized protein n=1 Tax=Diaporthe australafricana TaxID=127596 RepID=A0ABR3X177_9PEZI
MTSLKPFANKVIAVSGAASGIGFGIAQYLVDRGAILSLADVQHQALETAVAGITARDPENNILSTKVDVRKSQEVKEWISKTVERLRRLDGAANIAGVATKNNQWNAIGETDDDVWDFVIDTNLKGTIYAMREQLEVLQDGGSVVNASSVAGFRALPSVGCAPYVASKHGIIGASKAAAYEYGKRNIRVNCICP